MNPNTPERRAQVASDFAAFTSAELLSVVGAIIEMAEVEGPEGEVLLQELRKRLLAEEANRMN